MTGIIPPEELVEQMETPMETTEETPETPGDELAAVREVVLRAHPDVVPELVSGATVAEVLASVEPARAAYARIAERLTPAAAATATAPTSPNFPSLPSVPAGGAGPVPLDPDRLPAPEKIRRGLASR
jgi:hypothetical protein